MLITVWCRARTSCDPHGIGNCKLDTSLLAQWVCRCCKHRVPGAEDNPVIQQITLTSHLTKPCHTTDHINIVLNITLSNNRLHLINISYNDLYIKHYVLKKV